MVPAVLRPRVPSRGRPRLSPRRGGGWLKRWLAAGTHGETAWAVHAFEQRPNNVPQAHVAPSRCPRPGHEMAYLPRTRRQRRRRRQRHCRVDTVRLRSAPIEGPEAAGLAVAAALVVRVATAHHPAAPFDFLYRPFTVRTKPKSLRFPYLVSLPVLESLD